MPLTVKLKTYPPGRTRYRQDIRWRQSIVYSEDEARAAGINYVYWRKWYPDVTHILSDDGFVVEVLGVNRMASPRNKADLIRLRVPRTKVFLTQAKPFLWNVDHARNLSIGELRRRRARLTIAIYVRMLLRHAVNFDMLGALYSPNSKNPSLRVRMFLKHEETEKMVRDEVAKAMLGAGFDVPGVAKEYRELIEMCKEKKDRENFRLTLEKLAEMLDMMPERQLNTRNVNMNLGGSIDLTQLTGESEGGKLIEEAEAEMQRALEVKNATIQVESRE